MAQTIGDSEERRPDLDFSRFCCFRKGTRDASYSLSANAQRRSKENGCCIHEWESSARCPGTTDSVTDLFRFDDLVYMPCHEYTRTCVGSATTAAGSCAVVGKRAVEYSCRRAVWCHRSNCAQLAAQVC